MLAAQLPLHGEQCEWSLAGCIGHHRRVGTARDATDKRLLKPLESHAQIRFRREPVRGLGRLRERAKGNKAPVGVDVCNHAEEILLRVGKGLGCEQMLGLVQVGQRSEKPPPLSDLTSPAGQCAERDHSHRHLSISLSPLS